MEECSVTVAEGRLKGKTAFDYFGRKFYSFRGVPYAKPPVNDLRFKAPEPLEPWTGTKDATHDGNGCFSHHMLHNELVGSEDCLFLNIYTRNLPSQSNAIKKPVMFFIHGGGFTKGSNNSEIYSPDYLMHQDIVLVTVNYRLGMLGFINFEEESLGIPGNAGLKDIVMALKWMKKNISVFGGDSDNVTAFGNSAGAAAVHYLMLSPMAKGLFHKAIAQSGTALNFWAWGTRGIKSIKEVLKMEERSEKEVLDHLRKIPVEEILKIQDSIKDSFDYCDVRSFAPIVEKPSLNVPIFLSDDILLTLESGKYIKVPLIIGYTSREGLLFDLFAKLGIQTIIKNFENCVPYILNTPKGSELSKKIATKVKEFYMRNQTEKEFNEGMFYDMRSDMFINRAVYASAKLHIATSNQPVYFYRLSAETKLNIFKNYISIDKPGACHADELGYLFKTTLNPSITPNSPEETAMLRITKFWANFSRTGDPNPKDNDPLFDVIWEPATKDTFKFLDIGTTLSMQTNPDKERMAFWNEIYKLNPRTSKM